MSISTAPVQAAGDLASFADKVRAFIVIARRKAQNGLTVAEFGELMIALLQLAVAAADVLPHTGEERKSFVLEAVAVLFDTCADYCVPTLAYPLWLVVRPAVRSLVLAIASGAVEALLPVVRST
ncbi:MAG: hypothetical protein EBZ59_05665 [Planctomycetia bacterium]|nr:hypothetical protein [Planctomycetia bacterium]